MNYEDAELIFHVRRMIMLFVRRIGIILGLVVLAGISTGTLDYLHRRQHERQTAQWLAAMNAAAIAHHQPLPAPPPSRNESNCPICLILHLPFAPQMAQATIASLGLLALASKAPPATVMVARFPLPKICRGPPTC